MSDTTTTPGPGGAPRPGKPIPVAAIAGALVLVGLVGVALYRRAGPDPGGAGEGAPPAAAAPDAAVAGAPEGGTTVAARAPARLSPEATILVERYRCICGCNDPLGVCTCQIAGGSEEMKVFVEALARRGLSPVEADREMEAKFGPAALLANPAPPQTRPSHASPGGAPPAAR